MSDSYLSWEDLLDPGTKPQSTETVPYPFEADAATAGEPEGGGIRTLDELRRVAGNNLPEELVSLLKEKEAIERELMVLSGQTEEPPQDPRQQACFLVPVHTKESRILDRVEARLEERRRMAEKRRQERIVQEVRQLRTEAERRAHDEKRRQEARMVEWKRQHARTELILQLQREQRAHRQWTDALDARRKAAALDAIIERRNFEREQETRMMLRRQIQEQVCISRNEAQRQELDHMQRRRERAVVQAGKRVRFEQDDAARLEKRRVAAVAKQRQRREEANRLNSAFRRN